ncbi:glycoside hydrolase family 31 protein [Chitinophaga rhizosphaerae]|uniref:glycoside hydrolase family 31 protein n=1 Tax=Chitinophaga rhizosphaerae TaxID=1864947 RepID=UPI000F803F58|nr:TIM-barrel domain-containing protein [Chitinophaga rhizosphaerae]
MIGRMLSLCLLITATTAAQQVVTPGNVTGVDISGQTIRITAAHAKAEITAWSHNVVRVRMDRQELGKDFSYAVVATPKNFAPVITQNENEIRLETDSLVARIGKQPFSVTFLTKSGEVLQADEPGLGTSWIGEEVTAYKTMQDGERFLGLGEKTGNLDRRGSAYTNWNTDAFGYTVNQDPIYATIPFYIGVHHGKSYGLFFDNSFRTNFNFGASNNRFASFSANSGEMNYYFIHHPEVAGIISAYTWLTGRMPMPPMWSLGYQQNRYSYYPEAEVMRIAQTMREKQIPADGITLDIHYMDAYKLFTWNKQRFPDPAGMNARLRKMGFRTTVIVDPGIKTEANYPAFESGKKADIFIKYSDGQYYTGQVWPGWCHFPDFTGAKGRSWWKDQVKGYVDAGVDGLWNDMNEIATWGQNMPDNVLFDFEGRTATHREAHNVYGLTMVRASYEGARAAMQGRRPFILTRAGYAGLQRYTAIWTGDNRAEDDHMLLGVRLMNSLGLSGVAFSGMDIGGFTGNGSPALYARWIQLGAFLPYCRSHTGINTKSAEPWAFGEEVLEIARNYINLRYRLLPYLYSGFHEASATGMPLMRTLAIGYTHDPLVYDPRFQNQFLLGDGILVAPFDSKQTYAPVYLPGETWYNLYNDAKEASGEKMLTLGMHTLPVYIRESSIIPMQSLVQSTAEKPADTLFLHVYKGARSNRFEYYEDDGETFAYQKGASFRRVIRYEPADGNLVLEPTQSGAPSHFRQVQLVLHGFGNNAAKVNGTERRLTVGEWVAVQPVSRFDPQGVANPVVKCEVKTLTLPNDNQSITVNVE